MLWNALDYTILCPKGKPPLIKGKES
uniref:Uncharacterized protein n=1 Tax=Rhizophora mucronata TaxID=61149 RepID=A0A2P2QD62_RHIMU